MPVYTRMGRNWGVGMPMWLAPFLFFAWCMWLAVYVPVMTTVYIVRLQVRAVRWAHGRYLARRSAD